MNDWMIVIQKIYSEKQNGKFIRNEYEQRTQEY